MTLFSYSLIFLGLYVSVLAGISWRARYHDAGEGFVIGSRQCTLPETTAGVVGVLRSGSALPLWFMIVLTLGWWSYLVIAAYYLAILVMAWLAPRVRERAFRENMVTIPDLVESGVGPLSAKIVNAATLLVVFLGAAAQIFIGGTVLGGLLGIGTGWGIWFSTVIVGTYLWIGGYQTLIRTDLFQVIVMILLAVGAFAIGELPDLQTEMARLETINWNMLIGMAFTCTVMWATPDLWQRFYSANSAKTARRACFIAIGIDTLIVFGIIAFTSGIAALSDESDPFALFAALFAGEIGAPVVVALFGIFLFSALMSTLDNFVYVIASQITKNVARVDFRAERARFIRWLRAVTIILLIALSVLAMTINDFIQYILSLAIIVIVIGPAIIYAAISARADPVTDRAVALIVLFALALSGGMFAAGLFDAHMWLYAVPTLATAVPLAVFSRLRKARQFR